MEPSPAKIKKIKNVVITEASLLWTQLRGKKPSNLGFNEYCKRIVEGTNIPLKTLQNADYDQRKFKFQTAWALLCKYKPEFTKQFEKEVNSFSGFSESESQSEEVFSPLSRSLDHTTCFLYCYYVPATIKLGKTAIFPTKVGFTNSIRVVERFKEAQTAWPTIQLPNHQGLLTRFRQLDQQVLKACENLLFLIPVDARLTKEYEELLRCQVLQQCDGVRLPSTAIIQLAGNPDIDTGVYGPTEFIGLQKDQIDRLKQWFQAGKLNIDEVPITSPSNELLDTLFMFGIQEGKCFDLSSLSLALIQPPSIDKKPKAEVPMPAMLEKRLLENGWKCVSVKGDGNCQFRAIARVLTKHGMDFTHRELRKMAVAWIVKHANTNLPNDTTVKGFVVGDFNKYLEGMAEDSWGDHLTLIALSYELQLHFKLITTYDTNFEIDIGDGQPIQITLAYWHEYHYCATDKV